MNVGDNKKRSIAYLQVSGFLRKLDIKSVSLSSTNANNYKHITPSSVLNRIRNTISANYLSFFFLFRTLR